MELTITIPDEVRQILEQRARAHGQDIKTFVETILKTTISPSINDLPAPASVSDEEFESDMLAFAEKTDHLPPYSGTYSRADIYFDHD